MPTVLTIVGNLVKDPEEKDFGPNKNVTKMRVACSDRIPDGNGGWKDGDTAFYNISAWRNLGKHALSTLKKGDRVIVQGKLKYSEFKRSDGSNGHNYDIEATDLGIALNSKTAGTKSDSSGSKITISSDQNPWS